MATIPHTPGPAAAALHDLTRSGAHHRHGAAAGGAVSTVARAAVAASGPFGTALRALGVVG